MLHAVNYVNGDGLILEGLISVAVDEIVCVLRDPKLVGI